MGLSQHPARSPGPLRSLAARVLLLGGIILAFAAGAWCQRHFDAPAGLWPARGAAPSPSLNDGDRLAPAWLHHWLIRDTVIRLQASALPAGVGMLLGDSNIEGMWWNRLPVEGRECVLVNAGYGGIGVVDLLRRAGGIVEAVRPRFVVLMVGVNDATTTADPERWAADYERLVGVATSAGAAPILFTVIPPERGHPWSEFKSPAMVNRFNDRVRGIAGRRGAILIDIASAVVGADGQTRPGTTADGIHPAPALYREMATRWLPAAIRDALGRRGEACVSG